MILQHHQEKEDPPAHLLEALKKEGLQGLMSPDIQVFIESFVKLEKGYLHSKPKYQCLENQGVKDILTQAILGSIKKITSLQGLDEEKLIQFFNYFSLSRLIPSILFMSPSSYMGDIEKLFFNTPSVNIHTALLMILINASTKKGKQESMKELIKVQMTITPQTDLKMLAYYSKIVVPKCFTNLDEDGAMKLNLISSVHYQKIDFTHRLSVSQVRKYASCMLKPGYFWIIEEISKIYSQPLIEGIFTSILESPFDYQTMRFQGVEQYISLTYPIDKTMIEASIVLNSRFSQINALLKDLNFQNQDQTRILKFPISSYGKLKRFPIKEYSHQELTALSLPALKALKSFTEFTLEKAEIHRLGGTFAEPVLFKLSVEEFLVVVTALFDLCSRLRQEEAFLPHVNYIHQNGILHQIVKIILNFLSSQSNEIVLLCWKLFKSLADNFKLYIGADSPFDQIFKTTFLSDINSILTTYPFSTLECFPNVFSELMTGGYKILLERSPNKQESQQVSQRLFIKVLKYSFSYHFLKSSLKSRSSRRIDTYEFSRQHPFTVLFVTFTDSQLMDNYSAAKELRLVVDEVLEYDVDTYLKSEAAYQRVVRVARVLIELCASTHTPAFKRVSEEAIIDLFSKYPLLIEVHWSKTVQQQLLKLEYYNLQFTLMTPNEIILAESYKQAEEFVKAYSHKQLNFNAGQFLEGKSEIMELISSLQRILAFTHLTNWALSEKANQKREIPREIAILGGQITLIFSIFVHLLRIHSSSTKRLLSHPQLIDKFQEDMKADTTQECTTDIHTTIGNCLKSTAEYLSTIFSLLNQNESLNQLEKSGEIETNFYSPFVNGIQDIFHELQACFLGAFNDAQHIQINFIANLLIKIYLEENLPQPITYARKVYKKVQDGLEEILKLMSDGLGQSTENVYVGDFICKGTKGTFEQLVTVNNRRKKGQSLDCIKHLNFQSLIKCFFGIETKNCQYKSTVCTESSQKLKSKQQFSLYLEQYQLLVSLITPTNISMFKDTIFSYIRGQLHETKNRQAGRYIRQHHQVSRLQSFIDGSDFLHDSDDEDLDAPPLRQTWMRAEILNSEGRIGRPPRALQLRGNSGDDHLTFYGMMNGRQLDRREAVAVNIPETDQKEKIMKIQGQLFMRLIACDIVKSKLIVDSLIKSCLKTNQRIDFRAFITKATTDLRLSLPNVQIDSGQGLNKGQKEVLSLVQKLYRILCVHNTEEFVLENQKLIFFDTTLVKNLIQILEKFHMRKHNDLMYYSVALLNTCLPNITEATSQSVIPKLYLIFQRCRSAAKILRTSEPHFKPTINIESQLKIEEIITSIVLKTMADVTNVFPESLPQYSEMLNLQYLKTSKTPFQGYLRAVNPGRVYWDLEAEIKSYFFTVNQIFKDLNPREYNFENCVQVQKKSFSDYFKKYAKYEPFHKVMRLILSQKEGNVEGRNVCFITFKKRKCKKQKGFKSSFTNKWFKKSTITFQEKQLLALLHSAILKQKVLTKQLVDVLAKILPQLGVLTPYFLLSQIEPSKKMFIDLLVELIYDSPLAYNLLLVLCLDKVIVIKQNNREIQFSSYVRWKILLKVFSDLKKGTHKTEGVLSVLLYMLQLKQTHEFLKLSYSPLDNMNLKEFLQEKYQFTCPFVAEILFLIYRNQNIESLKGLYEDTNKRFIVSSQTRFDYQLAPLPFIYNQQDRRDALRKKSTIREKYQGNFEPVQDTSSQKKTDNISKSKGMRSQNSSKTTRLGRGQTRYLSNYYTEMVFEVEDTPPARMQEITSEQFDSANFSLRKPCAEEVIHPNLGFISQKNKIFIAQFQFLLSILHPSHKKQFVELYLQDDNEGIHRRFGADHDGWRQLRLSNFFQMEQLPRSRGNYILQRIQESMGVPFDHPMNQSNLLFEINRMDRMDRIRNRELDERLSELQEVFNNLDQYSQNEEEQQDSGDDSDEMPLTLSGSEGDLEEIDQDMIPPPVSNRVLEDYFQPLPDIGNNLLEVGAMSPQESNSAVYPLLINEEVIEINHPNFRIIGAPEPIHIQQSVPLIFAGDNIEPIQENQELQEIPVNSRRRQILDFMELPQDFLQTNNIDQQIFDELPPQLQLSTLEQIRGQIARQHHQEVSNNIGQRETLLALVNETVDPELRFQILSQVQPRIRDTFPMELQQQFLNRLTHQNRAQYMRGGRMGRLGRAERPERPPRNIVYPPVGEELFPAVSESAILKILKTLLTKQQPQVQCHLIETLLENKRTRQMTLNTLIFVLRDPVQANQGSSKIPLIDCNSKHQYQIQMQPDKIKLKVLEVINCSMKTLLYKDQTFMDQKYSYKMLGDTELGLRSELHILDFNTNEFHHPFFQLLLESLKLNSPLSCYLIGRIQTMNNLPSLPYVIYEEIINCIMNKDMSDEFIEKLKYFSQSQILKELFSKRISDYESIEFWRYGKIVKYHFAKPPCIKKLHLKALNTYRIQYNEFLNNIYIYYTPQELMEIPELTRFQSIHQNVMMHLFKNKKDICQEPIFRILGVPSMVSFQTKKDVLYYAYATKFGVERRSSQKVELTVRRNQDLQTTYQQIMRLTKSEIRSGFNTTFQGEFGVDAGALTREWFESVSGEILKPDYVLFELSSFGNTYHPTPKSDINSNHLDYFKFVGRFVGKALIERCLIDIHFSHSFIKFVLGQQLTFKDMESFDPKEYQSMQMLLKEKMRVEDNDLLFFSETIEKFGQSETIDLIPNGSNIPVTEENKHQFARLRSLFKMKTMIQPQTEAFKAGLYEVIPSTLLKFFTPEEFQLLTAGIPKIDVNDFKRNTEYRDYDTNTPVIIWFWEIVSKYDQEDLAKLVQFITGSSKVPSEGFKGIRGGQGNHKINIKRTQRKKILPLSHACFNQLQLPEYESKEVLEKSLAVVLKHGHVGYGLEGE